MEIVTCIVKNYLCDKCQTKLLYVYEENSVKAQKYIHICPECQTKYEFGHIYPHYEYKEKNK